MDYLLEIGLYEDCKKTAHILIFQLLTLLLPMLLNKHLWRSIEKHLWRNIILSEVAGH